MLQKLVRSSQDSSYDGPIEKWSGFVGELAKKLAVLPRLRNLTFTEAPSNSFEELEDGELDGFVYCSSHEISGAVSKKLVELCNECNVKLSVHYAICTGMPGCF